MRKNILLKITSIAALLWFDMAKWGIPLLSLSATVGFVTSSVMAFASVLAYLGTVYGIYLVNPPTNILGVITIWLIEGPTKALIPFLIIMAINMACMKVMGKSKNAKTTT